jgi:exodeoxyribonuclease VII small subunit
MVVQGMSNSDGTASGDAACFEDALAELERIVHQLEEGQLGLAEALARYEQGVKHLKHCYQVLQEAERKIEILTGVREDGTAVTQPFSEETASLDESAGRKRGPRKSKSPPPLSVADEDDNSPISPT